MADVMVKEQRQAAADAVFEAAAALARAATRASKLGLTCELEFGEKDISTIEGKATMYQSRVRVVEVKVAEFLPS